MDIVSKHLKVKAIIIKEEPLREYDKILTLLTENYGKIKVFSNGSRKANSKNLAKTRLLVFGEFDLITTKNSYILEYADIKNYFINITTDIDKIFLADYFIELIDYFIFENEESGEQLKLLYYALSAIEKNKMDIKLIRRIFELKMLYYEGIYDEEKFKLNSNKTFSYICDFIINTKPNKLFSFMIKESFLNELEKKLDKEYKEKIERKFKTLKFINN